MADNPPIVKVDPNGAGRAPILSYNVPDSTAYPGRNLIRLIFDKDDNPFVLGEPVQVGDLTGNTSQTTRLRPEPGKDTPRDDDSPPITYGDTPINAKVAITNPQAGAVVSAEGLSATVQIVVEVQSNITPSAVRILSGSATVDATRRANSSLYDASWNAQGGALALTAQAMIDGLAFESPPVQISIALTAETHDPPPDTTPPTLGEIRPSDGTTVTLDPGTSQASVQVSGSVSDNDGGVTVSIGVDGGQQSTIALQGGGPFSARVTISGPGPHVVSFSAVDDAKNRSDVSLQIIALQQTAIPKYELMIVEYLTLSNFLGAYGAGRTVQTFSLLPGERTKISIKTFQSTTATNSSTSSFLDSSSGSTTTALEDAVNREQTTKTSEDDSFKASASVEASASWGVASAKVSGSVAYGTSSAREQLGKSVINAVSRHASEVSAKRDVKVESGTTSSTTATDEQTVERTLENINVSRTLNFVFRQMNQEFISILHMVDVRIGLLTRYIDASGKYVTTDQAGSSTIFSRYREITLAQLEGLLSEIVRPELRAYVRLKILSQLDTVVDWKGRRRDIVSWRTLERPERDANGQIVDGKTVKDGPYIRFEASSPEDKPDDLPSGMDRYEDNTGNLFDVTGVILQATKVSLRSDGIMVDAILGGGNALDPYSTDLQQTAIGAKKLANDAVTEELERQELGRTLVSNLDGDAAVAAYTHIFGNSKSDGNQ